MRSWFVQAHVTGYAHRPLTPRDTPRP